MDLKYIILSEKNPISKRHILYGSIFKAFSKQNYEDHQKLVVARGLW
jgi:hypothetical protein